MVLFVQPIHVQWNLSIMDTLGTMRSILIKEVFLFQWLFSTLFYVHVAGTTGSVVIREVYLIWRFLIERFHCTYVHVCITELQYLWLLVVNPNVGIHLHIYILYVHINLWSCASSFSLSVFSLDMRLMRGDELHLRYAGSQRPSWDGVGHVIKVNNSILTLTWDIKDVHMYMCWIMLCNYEQLDLHVHVRVLMVYEC